MTTARAAALLGLVAAALMLPIALGPVRLNDSHWINFVWSEQFTALVRQGQVWPRWLPWSHDGLGAPVFYFYGPVAFWLAAVAGVAGLATWPALIAAAGMALWASGVTIYLFLEGTRRPLAGALLYMALPYHLLDFALRGALAEFTAFAALPLVALGIRLAGEGRIGLLAFSYALLICTHLPTALLASVFLLPLLIYDQWRRRPRALRRCAAGLGWGIALAAPYLLPAILLQSAASLGTMSSDALRPDAWSPFATDPGLRHGLAFLALVGGASVLVALPHLRRQPWAWFALATAGLALGLAPPVWRLPLLDRVQFPWRLLSLTEFAAAMIVARSPLPLPRLLLLSAPALVLSVTILMTPTGRGGAPSLEVLRRHHPDVIEYLPPGAGEQSGAGSPRALALAARTPAARTVDGWTVERRFAFPGWRVRCGEAIVPSGADPATGLLRHRGGGADCRIERRRTWPELAGLALALLALGAPVNRRACRAWSGARRAGPSTPRYRRPTTARAQARGPRPARLFRRQA